MPNNIHKIPQFPAFCGLLRPARLWSRIAGKLAHQQKVRATNLSRIFRFGQDICCLESIEDLSVERFITSMIFPVSEQKHFLPDSFGYNPVIRRQLPHGK
tara:strand:- start:7435 stop:7734 length:300 start_codon:yes stop_codon:yes gene_type:complete